MALQLLRDVLDRYRHSAFLDIELKVEGFVSIALDLLRGYPLTRGVVISSFLPDVLTAVHSLEETVPLGLICETNNQLSASTRLPIHYLILHHKLLDRDAMQHSRSAESGSWSGL